MPPKATTQRAQAQVSEEETTESSTPAMDNLQATMNNLVAAVNRLTTEQAQVRADMNRMRGNLITRVDTL